MFLLFCLLLAFLQAASYWVNVDITPKTFSYVAVSWINSSTVISAGNSQSGGSVIRSSDRGNTWSKMTITAPNRLFDIATVKLQNLIYILTVDDGGGVFLSVNSGTSWVKRTTLASKLISVCIGSNGNAFTTGQNNKIYRSSNTTTYGTWSNLSPTTVLAAYKGYFWGICSTNGINVIAVGDFGLVYSSSSAGNVWTAGVSGTNVTIYTVAAATSSVAMAAGASNYVAITYNNGLTWKTLNPFTVSGITCQFHTISFYNSFTGFVVGSTGTASYIMKTNDAGSTWVQEAAFNSIIYSLSVNGLISGVAGGVAGTGMYARLSDPTGQPSTQPSTQPTFQPFKHPTGQPTLQPMDYPSSQPSWLPTALPSQQPFSVPSCQPTNQPSLKPQKSPTTTKWFAIEPTIKSS